MAEPGMIYLRGNSVTVQDEAGGTVKVSGSPSVNRDISYSYNNWGVKRGSSRPDYGCIPSIPTDSNGKPMRFCSRGHYAPRVKFGKRTRNLFHGDKSGLDDICLDCRKVQAHNHKRTSSMAS